MIKAFRLSATILAGSLVYLLGLPSPSSSAEPATCVHPANSSSPAQCTFDIWGYVTLNGSPVSGALVYDALGSTTTDSNGFYDLDELEPGQYRVVAATSRCQTSQVVEDDAVSAVENGGQRVDFALPPANCS